MVSKDYMEDCNVAGGDGYCVTIGVSQVAACDFRAFAITLDAGHTVLVASFGLQRRILQIPACPKPRPEDCNESHGGHIDAKLITDTLGWIRFRRKVAAVRWPTSHIRKAEQIAVHPSRS
jgi:hypothetical protein